MIPDFPLEKQKLEKLWNHYLEVKHQELLGFLSEIPTYQHHEGHRWQINRQDGSQHESEYQELEAGFSVSFDEVPDLTPEKIRQKLDQVAEEMARQMTQGVLSTIEQAVDAAGNKINAGGKPLSPELFLEILERLELSFDEQGNWLPPTMIVPPDFSAARKEEIKAWESDPVFRAKQEEIVIRQREEWRAREACRKLVD